MDFKNVENIEQYAGVFSKVGEIKLSPTEFYDTVGIPEELRATFTVTPYNPVIAGELRNVNKAARTAATASLAEDGFDAVEIARIFSEVNSIFAKITAAEDAAALENLAPEVTALITFARTVATEENGLEAALALFEGKLDESDLGEGSTREYATLAFIRGRFQGVVKRWDAEFYALRDLARVYGLMVEHVVHVENLVFQKDDAWESCTGEVGMRELYNVQRDVLNWLDSELQRVSTLSDREIVGL